MLYYNQIRGNNPESIRFNNFRKVKKMKNYQIQIDVVMSGVVEIQATSKEDAKKAIEQMTFQAQDLKNFWQVKTTVVDVEKL